MVYETSHFQLIANINRGAFHQAFFTDKFALSQSDARISVAYKICQWKTLTKHLMKCPPDAMRFEDDFRLKTTTELSHSALDHIKIRSDTIIID